MGMSFSCPLANLDDLDSRFEAFLVKSMSFSNDDSKAATRSVSFNGRDSEPVIMKSFGSGKMVIEGSLSFKGKEMATKFSFRAPSYMDDDRMVRSASHIGRKCGVQSPKPVNVSEKKPQIPLSDSDNQRFQAALKLQKVYKSFRTRRQLADCAVLVEQRWWKLLDFAELTRSSVSFFDIEKPESVVSRWSRARTRAAKVGKGLSKDEKARKLALQHWLEAIDPRHRYGHNLQFYYVKWLQCASKQHFFYWLDIGEGKEANLERCPRSKLQKQCIKYLGPRERKAYEVVVEDGKFYYRQTMQLLDTREGPKDAKWIFVLSVSKTLYVGLKNKGTFQHSSFLAGGATLSAGRLVIEDGILKAVWPHSGHYLPTEENFEEFMLYLKENNVDLSIVQKSPDIEDEETLSKKTSLRNNVSVADFAPALEESNAESLDSERTESKEEDDKDAENLHEPLSKLSKRLHSNITALEIPRNEAVLKMLKIEEGQADSTSSVDPPETPVDGYETAEEALSDDEFVVSKKNLFDDDEEELEEEYEEAVLKEKIFQRIKSHKGMRSYQLAQQLTCKWTTGAGPRIGCVRDYPSELQFRVLEEVHLSPRSSYSSPRRSARYSPRIMTPTTISRESTLGKSPLSSEQCFTGS